MWHVTLNTNFAPKTAAAEQRVGDDLERFVRETLGDLDTWRRLIRIEPSFDAVETVRVDGVGIERGPKRHFMHVHMVVIVEHFGKVDHTYGQRQWQDLLKEKLPYLKGPNAKTSLMDGIPLNYVAKESGSAVEVRQLGIQPAVMF